MFALDESYILYSDDRHWFKNFKWISCYIDWTRELVTNLGSSMIQHLPGPNPCQRWCMVNKSPVPTILPSTRWHVPSTRLHVPSTRWHVPSTWWHMCPQHGGINYVPSTWWHVLSTWWHMCPQHGGICALNMVAYVHEMTFFVACV